MVLSGIITMSDGFNLNDTALGSCTHKLLSNTVKQQLDTKLLRQLNNNLVGSMMPKIFDGLDLKIRLLRARLVKTYDLQ